MKSFLFLLLQLISLSLFSQTDSTSIKRLFDRVLEFNESKVDSIEYYANLIEKESARIKLKSGQLLANRLKGIHAEYQGDYETAIRYYLVCLEESRILKSEPYELSALGDLAILYATIHLSDKSLEYNRQAMNLAMKRGEVSGMFTQLSNMGAVFNQMRKPDSALVYLEKAMGLATGQAEDLDLSSLNNNLGNAWFHKKQWAKALLYFRKNYDKNLKAGDQDMLWYDELNIADTYIEMKEFDSALVYLDRSFESSRSLSSRTKEAEVYQLYSKYYAARNQYQDAYDYFMKWHVLDTALVNSDTRRTIAELQERFHLKEREQENRLLELEISKRILQNRNIGFVAGGSILLALGTGIFFVLLRRKNRKLEDNNEMIQQQNERLFELNLDKNSLISIVSHDLGSPFTNIKMWNQLLKTSSANLDDDQLKAICRIQQSAENGENMIRNILEIEKMEMKLKPLSLEPANMVGELQEVVNDFLPKAREKEIHISFKADKPVVQVLVDRERIRRVMENLLSNAIKFNIPGKNVYVSVHDNEERVKLRFQDEGVGMEQEDLKYLYVKYRQLSSKPTGNESSTGLGLAIVKRLLDEIGGEIHCESEPGKGTCFTVILKK